MTQKKKLANQKDNEIAKDINQSKEELTDNSDEEDVKKTKDDNELKNQKLLNKKIWRANQKIRKKQKKKKLIALLKNVWRVSKISLIRKKTIKSL